MNESSNQEAGAASTEALSDGARRFLGGDTEGALRAAREVLRARPGDALAQHLMALSFFADEQYLLAYEIFDALAQRVAGDPVISFNAGAAALRCGNNAEATQHLQQAVGLRSDYPRAYGYLALAHLQGGDLELAQAAMLEGNFGEAGELLVAVTEPAITERLSRLEALLPPPKYVDPAKVFVEVSLRESLDELGFDEGAGEDDDFDPAPVLQLEAGLPAPFAEARALIDSASPISAQNAASGDLSAEDEHALPRQLMVSGEIVTGRSARRTTGAVPVSPRIRPVTGAQPELAGSRPGAGADPGRGGEARPVRPSGVLQPGEKPEATAATPGRAAPSGNAAAAGKVPVDPATLARSEGEGRSATSKWPPDVAASAVLGGGAAEVPPSEAWSQRDWVIGVAGCAAVDSRSVSPDEAAPGLRLGVLGRGVAVQCEERFAIFRLGGWGGARAANRSAVVRADLLLLVEGRILSSPTHRRARGADGTAFAVGRHSFVRITGEGLALMRRPDERGIRILSLAEGETLFLREGALCGFGGALRYENGQLPGAPDVALIRFSGEGQVVASSEAVLELPVCATAPAVVRVECLLGWRGDIVVYPAAVAPPGFVCCAGHGVALVWV